MSWLIAGEMLLADGGVNYAQLIHRSFSFAA